MLRLIIPSTELFDESTETFQEIPRMELELEHSLSSLSKWEEEWEKPFLSDDEKTQEEILSYVYHMQISPGATFNQLNRLSKEHYEKINEYIAAKHTATTFNELQKKGGRGETVTSELIYYWMVAFNIPFECQHWNLNRLLTLVRICNIKNQPEKKMSKHEIAARNRALNEERRAKLKTKG